MHLCQAVSYSLAIGVFLQLAGCVDSEIAQTQLPQVDYFIEKEATGSKENRLLFYASDPSLMVEISGPDNLSADVPFNELVPMMQEVNFSYDMETDYDVRLRIYLPDGTLYQEDLLSWTHSTSLPPQPVVGFREVATNDENVIVLVSSSRGKSTTDLWIEGDLADDEFPNGSWREIPPTGMIPLRVNDGDGVKRFTVKTRNLYQNESEPIEISVIRKSAEPAFCTLYTEATKTNTPYIRVGFEAEDTYDLQYRVYGHTYNDSKFHEFNGFEVVDVELIPIEGEREVTFQIRDIAENYCLKEKITFVYDPVYNPASIELDSLTPYFSNTETVNIKLRYDALPEDNIEMYLYGNIEGNNVETWIPFSETAAVKLKAYEGYRFIRVKFRENDIVTAAELVGLYLRPNIYINGTGASRTIRASDVPGLETINILGCQENLNNLVIDDINGGLFSCTKDPGFTSATIEYFFDDGTSTTVSKDF